MNPTPLTTPSPTHHHYHHHHHYQFGYIVMFAACAPEITVLTVISAPISTPLYHSPSPFTLPRQAQRPLTPKVLINLWEYRGDFLSVTDVYRRPFAAVANTNRPWLTMCQMLVAAGYPGGVMVICNGFIEGAGVYRYPGIRVRGVAVSDRAMVWDCRKTTVVCAGCSEVGQHLPTRTEWNV